MLLEIVFRPKSDPADHIQRKLNLKSIFATIFVEFQNFCMSWGRIQKNLFLFFNFFVMRKCNISASDLVCDKNFLTFFWNEIQFSFWNKPPKHEKT